MANPAILSKNSNYLAGNGLTSYDSGSIVIQTKAGVPPVKQADGTQQSATSLACTEDAGYPGNYFDGTQPTNIEGNKATITNIALTSNVLTVTCANHFFVGQNIFLNGLTTNTVLNNVNVVILTCSGSQFTAAFTNANIVSGSDTGTATFTNASRGSGLSVSKE
jgi:hypothetical protein